MTDPKQALLSQNALFTNITNFVRNSINKVAETNRTKSHFVARLQLLESYWSTFIKRDELLLLYASDDELKSDKYFTEDRYNLAEAAYVRAKCVLTDELEKLLAIDPTASSMQSPPPVNFNNVHAPTLSHSVPKVVVPTFNGKQAEWETFKELFTAVVIDDTRIPPIVKLQHLLNSVQGPAQRVLAGVKVSPTNFLVAWDKLLRRYDVRKRRLQAHLQALIDLPLVLKGKAEEIALLIDRAEEAVKGLRDLECPVDQFDIWFVYLVSRKLDADTKESWNFHEEGVENFSTYVSLRTFLENRMASLEPLSDEEPVKQKQRHLKSIKAHVAQDSENSDKQPKKSSTFSCAFCSGGHTIFRCTKLVALPVQKRLEFVKSKKLCPLCLSSKHSDVENCTSSYRCPVGDCGGKHAALLHTEKKKSVKSHKTKVERNPSESESSTTSECSSDVVANNTQCLSTFARRLVLLPTAKVILRNQQGDKVEINALIDHASMSSFVSKSVVSALDLLRQKTNIDVIGVGEVKTANAKRYCELSVQSKHDSNFTVDFQALVLGQVTSQLPPREFKVGSWPHLNHLALADPQYMKPKPIDCILGSDVYARILRKGIKIGPPGTPSAQYTALGWIVVGAVNTDEDHSVDVHSNICINSFFTKEEISLSDTLSKFWEIEQLPKLHPLTKDEQDCEQHFAQTVFRQNGRYGVCIPFKTKPNFPGSEFLAKKSWLRLEKRFAQKAELKIAYDAFMSEYLELGHMEEVPKAEIAKDQVYYIPHHAVFHNNRIRVVFNASMPSLNRLSLNDTMHIGPKLQQDIVKVLIRWRFFGIVFSCDIVKMFRQILVHPADRDWLRILYNFGNGLQHFRLCTVTYGTACAPYQSLRIMRQIIQDYCPHDPVIIDLFNNLSYVDDFFGGADTIEQASKIRDKLISTLEQAKIQLGKWSTNTKAVLTDSCILDQSDKQISMPEITSALGLKWSPTLDVFSFQIQSFQSSRQPLTKRIALSESAKLFDPLGWVSPVIIQAKVFIQQLWIDGYEWDTPISGDLLASWNHLKSFLDGIESLRIPRWLGSKSNSVWSLHGFADASKMAYSACLYYVPAIGQPALICAKTKVAPVKTLSIPRLELCAAHLLSKLIEFIKPSFTVQPIEINCWSDSRNVLCLLQILPAKLKVFEANRVSEIITTLPNVKWRYVPSGQNPADCATRGMSAADLRKFDLWWSGPSWLQCETDWPSQPDLQKSKTVDAVSTSLTTKVDETVTWLQRFSSFSKLVRVVATMLRWRNYCRDKIRNFEQPLSSLELQLAREKVLRYDQSLHFETEIKALEVHKSVPRKGKLARFNPFLDERGLIRVGSRLENSPFLSFGEKYPILLDRYSVLSRMIVQDYHRAYLHGGPQLVWSAILRHFYIICGKRVVTSVISKCPKCLRYAGRCLGQQMASVPTDRLSFEFPFSSTGIDYAGPFKITPSRGRGITSLKGYLSVFICLVTRAVHLEIVSDLTAEAFLAAFDRFTNRRNLPRIVYSDNGRNFVSAENELRQLFAENSEFSRSVVTAVNNQGIEWVFSPPHAPHFGGIWEAAVKSFKFHFNRVVGLTPLTFEEISTLATKIEACLNSRPICAISADSRDTVPLTPAHFLVGRPLKTLPPSSQEDDVDKTYTSRWKLLLAMRNNFANTWKKEVISQLMQYNKWRFPNRNLTVGDLVIIKDDLTPASLWPLARVKEVYSKGPRNLVRVATVQTENGSSYVRPIHRLIYLPVDDVANGFYQSHLTAIRRS